MARPEYDRALEGVLASPRILLPATRRVDVDRMLRFAPELKQPVVLYGVTEGYRSADLLKKANATGADESEVAGEGGRRRPGRRR